MPSDQRFHPLTVLFALGGELRNFLAPILFATFTARSRGGDIENWLLIFMVPSVAIAAARYWFSTYRYDDTELVVRTGIMFKNERHIPYARIQSVDAKQNVFHRLFRVVEVRVQTGTGGEAEATMSVLPFEALAEMRARVFAGKKAAVPVVADAIEPSEAAPAPVTPVETILSLPVSETALSGLLDNRGWVVIGAASGLLYEAGMFLAAAADLTRLATPWLLEPVTWTPQLTERAVVWLAEQTGKAILKLTARDYAEHHLASLLATRGAAGPINGDVFSRLREKIRGRARVPHGRRVLVFSPHPDDDVISMGGLLRKLRENDNAIIVAYMTSGNIAVFDHDVPRHLAFVDRAAGALALGAEADGDGHRAEERARLGRPGASELLLAAQDAHRRTMVSSSTTRHRAVPAAEAVAGSTGPSENPTNPAPCFLFPVPCSPFPA